MPIPKMRVLEAVAWAAEALLADEAALRLRGA